MWPRRAIISGLDFFRPFVSWFPLFSYVPRLAPWAAFFRRHAAWSAGLLIFSHPSTAINTPFSCDVHLTGEGFQTAPVGTMSQPNPAPIHKIPRTLSDKRTHHLFPQRNGNVLPPRLPTLKSPFIRKFFHLKPCVLQYFARRSSYSPDPKSKEASFSSK